MRRGNRNVISYQNSDTNDLLLETLRILDKNELSFNELQVWIIQVYDKHLIISKENVGKI